MPYQHIGLLMAGIAVIGANSLMLTAIAGAVALSWPGVAAVDVMLAAAAYGIATAASALLLAPHADRLGAERLLVRALGGLGSALAVAAAAPSLAVLIAAQAGAGIAAGAALPAIYSLAAQVAPAGRANATLSAVLVGWTLSLVVGVAVAAALADWAHWRVVYVALAAMAVAVAAGTASMPGWGAAVAPAATNSAVAALRVPGAPAALAVVACYMTAFYGTYGYLGPHLHDTLDLATAHVGLASLAYGLGFGLAAPIGHLLDRAGPERAAGPAFVLLAAAYASLAAAAGSAAALIGLAFLWGALNHAGLNLVVSRVVALDRQRRAALMGLYSAVTYAAVTSGTLLFRPVYEASGFRGCALLAAGCILPALLIGRCGPHRAAA